MKRVAEIEVEVAPNPEYGCPTNRIVLHGSEDLLLSYLAGRWFLSIPHRNHRHIVYEDTARALLQMVLEGPMGGKRETLKKLHGEV